MPYNLHVVHAGDFIPINCKGGIGPEATKAVLSGPSKACVDHGVSRALIDARKMNARLSMADLRQPARAFEEPIEWFSETRQPEDDGSAVQSFSHT